MLLIVLYINNGIVARVDNTHSRTSSIGKSDTYGLLGLETLVDIWGIVTLYCFLRYYLPRNLVALCWCCVDSCIHISVICVCKDATRLNVVCLAIDTTHIYIYVLRSIYGTSFILVCKGYNTDSPILFVLRLILLVAFFGCAGCDAD